MEPTDLTVKILQELRDGQKEQTQEIHSMRDEMREDRTRADQRFEVIETSLRDLAEQMVMLSRGIKVALESRSGTESRLDDHEKRLRELESRSH
jgi:DNA repair ATPase RecN